MIIKNPDVWFEGEENGEEVLFMMRPHVIINLGWMLAGLFLLALPFLILIFLGKVKTFDNVLQSDTILLVISVWSLIILGGVFQWILHWLFNIYILTNRRIVDIDFLGLFHRRVSQAPLKNIEDVTFSKKGLFQSFFDYGDLHVQTAGTLPNFDFHAIPDPEGSMKQMLNLVAKSKKGYGHYGFTDAASGRLEPSN